MEKFQLVTSLGAAISPIIFALTAILKKMFPEKITGIVTIAIALGIGLLVGLIFPQLGIGIGLFSSLVAITGATLADRVGEAIEVTPLPPESQTVEPNKVRYIPVQNMDNQAPVKAIVPSVATPQVETINEPYRERNELG